MGAFLRTHIEYKKDGRWLHYAAPRTVRDHRLIALITGVRSETTRIRPLDAPRGLPADPSEVTRICHEKDAGSTVKGETWLNGLEFAWLQKRWIELNPDQDPLDTDFEENVFGTYGPGGSAIAGHHGFDDVCVVFWVDD